MKNYIFFMLFFLTISCHSQKKETFSYKKASNDLVSRISAENQLDFKYFKNLTDYLPKGYSTDGTVDYTYYIQKGLNENEKIIFPNFPILVNNDGLKLKSNSQLVFQNKSKIQITPNSLEKYQILDIRNVENIIIYNPKLRGDRMGHKGSKGEWGMGINIISSKNITIYNPHISHCWGDGIYIGRSSLRQSENVKILGGNIDFNRRNGISVISGRNILIEKVLISNTQGTLPMAGIDLEPNTNEDVLENIDIISTTTFNNANEGIKMAFINFIGKRNKEVNIKIENHKDLMSKMALSIGGVRESQKGLPKMQGKIEILNSEWIDNNEVLQLGSNTRNLPAIILNRTKIENKEKKIFDGYGDVKKKFSNQIKFYD